MNNYRRGFPRADGLQLLLSPFELMQGREQLGLLKLSPPSPTASTWPITGLVVGRKFQAGNHNEIYLVLLSRLPCITGTQDVLYPEILLGKE